MCGDGFGTSGPCDDRASAAAAARFASTHRGHVPSLAGFEHVCADRQSPQVDDTPPTIAMEPLKPEQSKGSRGTHMFRIPHLACACRAVGALPEGYMRAVSSTRKSIPVCIARTWPH